MALHGKFYLNNADYSPLTFPGVGTFLAFSGGGSYRNHAAFSAVPGKGPVPPGRYWIVDRPAGGVKSRINTGIRDAINYYFYDATFKHEHWFALFPDNWGRVNDERWFNGVKRGNFRLHPGHISEGCITLPHDTDFASLRNSLLSTTKMRVECMKNMMAYGTIEVI